ncbi:MAG: HEAT repeat domain-containing protein [Microcoleaceae cyanobacterium]
MSGQLQDLSTSGSQQLLQQALRDLKFGDFHTRWEATKVLGRIGIPAIKPLITILEDVEADSEVQWFVARILGQFDTEEVVNALVNSLQRINPAASDEEMSVKQMIAVALANVGESAIFPLTNLLKTESLRQLATEALAQIRHVETIPALLQVTNDPNPQIRTCAIEALGSFHDPRVPPVLLNALQDTHATVRKEALAALGMRRDLQIELNLVKHLQPLLWDIRPEVSQQAQMALARFGTDEAAMALFEQIQTNSTPLPLKRDGVRALAWIETSVSLNYLNQIFQQAENWETEKIAQFPLCQEIIRVLGRVGKPEIKPIATDLLIELLNRSHAAIQSVQIQQLVASALGQLGQVHGIDSLIQLLSTTDTGVQLHCIAALKQLNAQLAHQQLTHLARQSDLPSLLKNGIDIALSEW